jgi:ATP-dependent protease HslVU (ClpYQ) peptidase subunit
VARDSATVTTVAFREGWMASDSRLTDGNVGVTKGAKLFRKTIGKRKAEHLIGVCGDLYAAMVFVDWYGSGDKALHDLLVDLDEDSFEVLIWDGKHLKTANRYCRLIEVEEPYYAIGSGGRHAITAMDCGKNAATAVQMAIKRDSNSGGRIVTMRLK